MALTGQAWRPRRTIGWTHPSMRDVVIEYLATDRIARQRFLGSLGLEGLTATLSGGGGAEGRRFAPLVQSERDVEVLARRVIELLQALTARDISGVLRVLVSSQAAMEAEGGPRGEWLRDGLLRAVVDELSRSSVWTECRESATLTALLAGFRRLSMLLKPLPPVPSLLVAWQSAERQVVGALTDPDVFSVDIAYEVAAYRRFVDMVGSLDPRVAEVMERAPVILDAAKSWASEVDQYLEQMGDLPDPEPLDEGEPYDPGDDEYATEEWADRVLEGVAELRRGFDIPPETDELLESVQFRSGEWSERLAERRQFWESYSEPPDDYEREPSVSREASVEALVMSDL